MKGLYQKQLLIKELKWKFEIIRTKKKYVKLEFIICNLVFLIL